MGLFVYGLGLRREFVQGAGTQGHGVVHHLQPQILNSVSNILQRHMQCHSSRYLNCHAVPCQRAPWFVLVPAIRRVLLFERLKLG